MRLLGPTFLQSLLDTGFSAELGITENSLAQCSKPYLFDRTADQIYYGLALVPRRTIAIKRFHINLATWCYFVQLNGMST